MVCVWENSKILSSSLLKICSLICHRHTHCQDISFINKQSTSPGLWCDNNRFWHSHIKAHPLPVNCGVLCLLSISTIISAARRLSSWHSFPRYTDKLMIMTAPGPWLCLQSPDPAHCSQVSWGVNWKLKTEIFGSTDEVFLAGGLRISTYKMSEKNRTRSGGHLRWIM